MLRYVERLVVFPDPISRLGCKAPLLICLVFLKGCGLSSSSSNGRFFLLICPSELLDADVKALGETPDAAGHPFRGR